VGPFDYDPEDDRVALGDGILHSQVKVGYRTENSSEQADHVFNTFNGAEYPSVPLSVLCEEIAKLVRIMLIEDGLNQLIDYLDVGLCQYVNCHAGADALGSINAVQRMTGKLFPRGKVLSLSNWIVAVKLLCVQY
jgi:hypothetical protein